jgi:hypothetical protein
MFLYYVAINEFSHDLIAPLGGYKQSGIGREYGENGLEAFMEAKQSQSNIDHRDFQSRYDFQKTGFENLRSKSNNDNHKWPSFPIRTKFRR